MIPSFYFHIVMIGTHMTIRYAIIDGSNLIDRTSLTLEEHRLLWLYDPGWLIEPLLDEMFVNGTQPGIHLQVELQEHLEYDQLDRLLRDLMNGLLSKTLYIRTNLIDRERITAVEMISGNDILFHITERSQPLIYTE